MRSNVNTSTLKRKRNECSMLQFHQHVQRVCFWSSYHTFVCISKSFGNEKMSKHRSNKRTGWHRLKDLDVQREKLTPKLRRADQGNRAVPDILEPACQLFSHRNDRLTEDYFCRLLKFNKYIPLYKPFTDLLEGFQYENVLFYCWG